MARGVDAILRVKKQSAKGAAATFTATDKYEVMPFTQESFKGSRVQVGSNALRKRAMRQKNLSKLGTEDVGGGFTFEATNGSLHNILPILFPADGITAIGSETAPAYAKQYVLTTSDLPYATVLVDDGEVVRAYADMKATQFSLSAAVNQFATFNVDMLGRKFQTNATGGSVAWADGITGNIPATGLAYASQTVEYGLFFLDGVLEVGLPGGSTAELGVENFSFTVNYNGDGDNFIMGHRLRTDVFTGMADVTGNFSLRANKLPESGITNKDWAYEAVQNGTYYSLKLKFTDTANPYKTSTASEFNVIFPFIYFETPDWNVNGPGTIKGGINFTAYADGADGLTIEHKYALDA